MITPLTIPTLLKKLKNHTLNKVFLNFFNGHYYTPESYTNILKDIYEDSLLLNRDTITVYLNDTEYTYSELNVKNRNIKDEELIERLFSQVHILDIVKLFSCVSENPRGDTMAVKDN